MRFDGRIQFEGVPDELDVTVEVSDTHLRMLSGDEVLGSWCLADVVANRKVANEFEIELPEETVTFRADDQVNFAYGAVQKMAEGWARYHSMNAMRRSRAVSNARRQNEPARLEAVKQALRDAGDALTAANAAYIQQREDRAADFPGQASTRAAGMEPTGGFWAKVRDATGASLDPSSDTGAEPETQADEDDLEQIERMRSSFGRRGLPRLDTFSDRGADPAAEPLPSVEPRPVDDPGLADEAPAPWIAPLPSPEPVPISPTVLPAGAQPSGPVTESDGDGSTVSGVPVTAVSSPPPTTRSSPPPTTRSSPPSQTRRRAARRLGAFGDGHHPAETSGIRATMRSMFSRSKAPHEHSFVATTTAAGISRRLCLECGQVSIGVTDGDG